MITHCIHIIGFQLLVATSDNKVYRIDLEGIIRRSNDAKTRLLLKRKNFYNFQIEGGCVIHWPGLFLLPLSRIKSGELDCQTYNLEQ